MTNVNPKCVNIGKPEENPQIVIEPVVDPVPREKPQQVPKEKPVRVPKREPVPA